ncbi:hypothetical protein [Streptomyces griseoruber]|uniref:hypothetical protein n=1 Tax=Streptomyces griseoruber TaxID=1943 RepID=UPI0037A73ABE
MIFVGLYLFTVLTSSAGLLGHPPVLASMTQRAVAWAVQRANHGRRRPPVRRVPSWAREEGQR